MRATIVLNTKEEKRLLIVVETEEEREFFAREPDLHLVRTSFLNDKLNDLSYEREK